MSPQANDRPVPAATVKWGIGLLVTVLLVGGSSLMTATSAANNRDSELRVLENRVDTMQAELGKLAAAISEISKSISEYKAEQAGFYSKVDTNLELIKTDLDRLHSQGSRRSNQRSPR